MKPTINLYQLSGNQERLYQYPAAHGVSFAGAVRLDSLLQNGWA